MKHRAYIFTSERLGFREWREDDVEHICNINADPEVMEFFPDIQSREVTVEFIHRMQTQYAEKGYCYFAVDSLDSKRFIGFIGLSEPRFEADFTPCVDMGWRLARSEWGKGYATEGAKRCLAYAIDDLGLQKVIAIAPKVNTRSVQVMEKIGMCKIKDFKHPLLSGHARLEECVLYQTASPSGD